MNIETISPIVVINMQASVVPIWPIFLLPREIPAELEEALLTLARENHETHLRKDGGVIDLP